MMLSNFIKPKWQHRNPNIRRSEVENLDDPAILNKVAQNDEAAEVRQAAVRKINELNLLDQIAQHDTDSSVREIAEQRLKQLLCCQEGDSPTLETRLTWLNKTTDADRLAYVAENGPEVELRMAAIEKVVERDGVLGNIAINDTNGKIRLLAVEKLTQKSTLERVVKGARNSDKRVSRRAREKLDEIERPLQLRAKCEEICASLDSLEQRLSSETSQIDDSKLKLANAEFKRLQESWQALAAEADTECQTRFDKAQQAVMAVFENYQQAQLAAQAREQARAPLRAAKQALCDQMEALLIDFKKRQRLDGEDEQLNALQSQWAETQALDDPAEEQQWQARFERIAQSVQKRQNQLQAYHKTASQMEAVCLKAETLLNKTGALKEEQLKKLQARWQEVSSQQDQTLPLFSELNSRFSNTLGALQKRLQAQKEQRSKTVQALKKLLTDMEAALEKGELKTLIPLEQQARELFSNIEVFSTTDQTKALERRLQKCSAEINKLRGWQNWGNKREREKLCEQVESLLETEDEEPVNIVRMIEDAQSAWKRLGASGYSRELWERFNKARQSAYLRYREHLCRQMENLSERADNDPEKVAKIIRQAQTTWKDLGAQGNSQALWERFNNASQKAYEPCRVHFEIKSQERQQNLEEKQAVCESLEAFAEETDWEMADWKEVYRFVREMEQKWRDTGPTDRRHKKVVQQRFQAAMQVLEIELDEERQRNCHYRVHLMLQVESVANNLQAFIDAQSSDATKRIEAKTNEAIEEVKKWQDQWQVTVPGNRRVEREFWTTFRSECDVVFNHRKQQQEAQKKQIQAYLNSKIVLCEQVEALANLEGEAIKTAPAQVKTIQGEWKNIRTDWNKIGNHALRRKAKASEAVDERFEQACQEVERRYHAQLYLERREQLDRLKQKAALCVELEQAETLDGLSTVQAAWADIPQLEEADLEAAIGQRFQQACTGAPKISKDALKNKETLCIRLELLAGIESPPEGAEARLAYQVARLSAALGGEEIESQEPQAEAEEIEQSWYLSGAAPSDQTARLEQRFSKACEAFYSQQ
jgi:hypothetical protein